MSNWHAKDSEGRNFKSKKAFREAVAAGENFTLTDTSLFNTRLTIFSDPTAIGPSDVIVGPDPYTARNWYANIKNGKVV